jgi:hypothetical protein
MSEQERDPYVAEPTPEAFGQESRARVQAAVRGIVQRASIEAKGECRRELADALSMPAETAWDELTSITQGLRVVVDIVIGTAALDDPVIKEKRAEFLAAMGVADAVASIVSTAEAMAEDAKGAPEVTSLAAQLRTRPNEEGDQG